ALTNGAAAYVTVSDSAANISTVLNALETAAANDQLTAINVTDSTGAITVTPAQLTTDIDALDLLSGNFYWVINETAGVSGIAGAPGVGTVIELSGSASQYTLTADSNGGGFTLTGTASTGHFTNIIALSFGGSLDFVATTPGPANAITT